MRKRLTPRRDSSTGDSQMRALAAAVILRARKDYQAAPYTVGGHGLKLLSWDICRGNEFDSPQEDVEAFLEGPDFEFWVADILGIDMAIVRHWILTGEGPGLNPGGSRYPHPHSRKR